MKVKRLAGMLVLHIFVLGLTLDSHGQVPVSSYLDDEYHYGFRYPTSWQLTELPEGPAHRLSRVLLRGPGGSLFTVNIVPLDKKTSQLEFQSHGDNAEIIKQLGQQTIEGIYRPISQNLRARELKIGETVNLSNAEAIQYSLSTLNQMAKGDPVVAAGIHVLPFGKDYRIDFTMIARLNRSAEEDNQLMTAVFNSFRFAQQHPKR